MTQHKKDVQILRDLARQVADIAAEPIQDELRDLWRRHNSLQRTRPLVYVRWFSVWGEVLAPKLRCEDPQYRAAETRLLDAVHQDLTGDDFIIEPWITVQATHVGPPAACRWGPEIRHSARTAARGSYKFDPPLVEEADLDKLVMPDHVIDEDATARNVAKLSDAIGDILTINVDRGPRYRTDVSHEIAQLVGLEQMMWYMCDRPQWLHRLGAFLRDGILRVHAQAEAAGDWRLANHHNQSMPYAAELDDPVANSEATPRSRLWHHAASQETTLVSPAMFDEFILTYQKPIDAEFGLNAFGCCEDLTRKIDVLRKIPNLRRIAVPPWSDMAACCEQIGTDYVVSWRPSPAEMISLGFDPDKVRRLTREGLEASRGCHVDITLKDIETIGGNFDNLIEWTRIVREVAEEFA